MLEFVGALAVGLVSPGATVPLLALSSGLSVVRAIRRRGRTKNDASNAHRAIANALENGGESVPVTLSWRAVNCSRAEPKRRNKRKVILQNIAGVARPGRVFAILGPSGSGKTTLLNAIAGRVPYAKGLSLSGEVTCNGQAKRPELAYVTQEDLFFSELSVEETLQFAVRMRLASKKSNPAERKQFVDQLVRKLGLATTVTTRVGATGGGAGISGGERKRLSLGCELISTPKVIICDEPTSGLDAFQAVKVMQTLKNLARAGHTVICSIHQPSSSLFELCDDILLLSGGRVVYCGEREKASVHFGQLGFPVPKNCNPAEMYLDLISIDYTSEEALQTSQSRIDSLVSSFAKQYPVPNAVSGPKADSAGAVVATPPQNIFAQFRALLMRAFRQATRDKKTNISRFMSSCMSALLFGAIYWKIGLTQSTIQDRMGMLQVCTINTAMTALVKTLNVFPKEAVLVNRERTKGAYSVLPYFVSKLCAELPLSAFFPLVFTSIVYPMTGLSGGLNRIGRFAGIITMEAFAAASYGLVIGSLVPNSETALAIGPPSFVLQIVFGGMFMTDKNVPKWASWIPKVSLIKHTFEALCVNEFRGLKFKAENPTDATDGQQVLDRLTWGDSTVSKSAVALARITAFNYLATFSILTLKKPRFQRMVHPSRSADRVQIEELVDEEVTPAPEVINGTVKQE